ncbi:MAG: nitrogenase cofactor biosynthesis protein NifB, partial [Candidatus Accumulibacter sp.]|nr:nitrogenase cofactor biosynthesis protein NifB [Accumulibacter sp.]
IAEAEHGTYYGLMEQASPAPAQLQELQDACAGDMAMMRHCRQCRADAVGLLGEDRGSEFTMDKVDALDLAGIAYEAAMLRRKEVHDEIIEQLEQKRAARQASQTAPPAPAGDGLPKVPTENLRSVLMAVAGSNGVVGEHFGHAREFLIYEASPAGARFVGHRKTEPYCDGLESCGDDGLTPESVLDRTIATLAGCEAVLCSKIGFEPWSQLEAAGIMPNGEHALEPIDVAVLAVYQEMAASGRLAQPAPSRKAA